MMKPETGRTIIDSKGNVLIQAAPARVHMQGAGPFTPEKLKLDRGLWIARRKFDLQAFLESLVGKPETAYAAGPSAWALTNTARTKFVNGQFDWDTDTLKIALFLSTSNIGAASTTYAGVTNEHANGNGYLTGGVTVSPGTLSGTTTVTMDVTTDPVWTSSGTITARFAGLYESGGDVITYMTLDSAPADVTVSSPNTLTIGSPTGIIVVT